MAFISVQIHLLFESTYLRLSGSVVPSSRKLKMLTQTPKHFQTRVFLTHHTEGIRADRPDFVDTVTKPHINCWFLSPNLINVPSAAPNSGQFLNCLHNHLPLLLLTSARRFLFCVMNSGTWTLQGNKCCRKVITPF